MEEVASVSVASRRAGMLLIVVFGALALVLAAAGIHGVMSHLVALRTAEIGVRMTLGARPSSVMALVIREGTLQALAGLAIGVTGGVLLMRTFQSVLFGVAPADPLTLVLVVGEPARDGARRVRNSCPSRDAHRSSRSAEAVVIRSQHSRSAVYGLRSTVRFHRRWLRVLPFTAARPSDQAHRGAGSNRIE